MQEAQTSSMSGPHKTGQGGGEEKLPRRDWILLPVISLMTIGLMLAVSELTARSVFPVSKTLLANCLVLNNPSKGAFAIPNSVCWEKSPEGPAVEYRFNSCGHRAGMECGPKPPGTYRIVMTGSSVALGQGVRREDTFAALLPAELSIRVGRKVELYNEGMGWGFSATSALRFDDVLNARPDLVLWALTPADVLGATFTAPVRDEIGVSRSLSLTEKAWLRMKGVFGARSFSDGASELFSHTRSSVLLKHLIYGSQSQFVRAFLNGPDAYAGFLKADLSPDWKRHLWGFESNAAAMEGRASAAGIPFVAVLVPYRAQAAMISMGEWPAGCDPYKLNEEVRSIITSHGGIYIDILPGFRGIPNPEQYYLPVNGHPNAQGQAIIADLLAKQLIGGAVPELKVTAWR